MYLTFDLVFVRSKLTQPGLGLGLGLVVALNECVLCVSSFVICWLL